MMQSSAFNQMGPSQQKLLVALLEHPDGLSVDQLIALIGVTANAIRQHVSTLERDGFVMRGDLRPTGRRPQQLFLLSAEGRELFPRRYSMMADQVIAAIRDKYGSEALVEMMRSLGTNAALDSEANLAALPVSEISTELAALMTELGYSAMPGTTNGADPEVIAHNCVFHHLASRYPEVCEFDLALIEAATGRNVEHTECMVRGGSVCRFCLKNPH